VAGASSRRRDEALLDLPEGGQSLAPLRVDGERGIVGHKRQARMRLRDEAQRAGHGDVGMADAVAELVGAGARGAVGFESGEGGRDLRAAAPSPGLRHLVVHALLVEQADGLVGEAGGEGGDAERAVAGGLGAGKSARSGGTRLSR
jgi:hypothetical protein